MVLGTVIMLIGLPARLLRERYIDDSPIQRTGKGASARDAA